MSARASTKTGWAMTITVWGARVHGTGQRRKTKMKESRYSASGTIHRSGMGERSTDMWVVVPSIKLDGIAASSIQRIRRQIVISSEGGGSTQVSAAVLVGAGA